MFENLLADFIAGLKSPEIKYSGLIFVLFIFPRYLIRFGIPYALSAFAMGVASRAVGTGLGQSEVVLMLSSLGIVSLFLFAGLEVEFHELNKNKKVIIEHVVVRFGLLLLASLIFVQGFAMSIPVSVLLSLALLTPSTGFILDNIDSSNLSDESKFWIRAKAIGAEIVALVVMFVMVRSRSFGEFGFSLIGLILLILALPKAFKYFAKVVAPAAPKSEFGFLLLMALFSGLVTKKLGVYYLVGAFIVGLIARRFQREMPQMTSKSMLKSLKFFTGFFTPFYFFHAGSLMEGSDFTYYSFLFGVLLILIFVPIRIYSVVLQRKLSLGEPSSSSFPISVALLPNLVFGLVLAELLKTVFHVSGDVFGAIIVYTIGVSVLPSFILKYFYKTPDFVSIAEAEPNFGSVDWRDSAPGKNE